MFSALISFGFDRSAPNFQTAHHRNGGPGCAECRNRSKVSRAQHPIMLLFIAHSTFSACSREPCRGIPIQMPDMRCAWSSEETSSGLGRPGFSYDRRHPGPFFRRALQLCPCGVREGSRVICRATRKCVKEARLLLSLTIY